MAVLAIAALLPQFKTLKTSEAGLALIANAEGCRTSPYQCSAGVWTNGIGHTEGVTPQSHVSERQAAVNLVYDVMRVERGIDACMPDDMPPPVYDAAVSFALTSACALPAVRPLPATSGCSTGSMPVMSCGAGCSLRA